MDPSGWENEARTVLCEGWRKVMDEGRVGKGSIGDVEAVSTGEWQRTLVGSGGSQFVYYGLGSMMSYLDPSCILGLDLSGVETMVLLDQVRTEQSVLRERQAALRTPKRVVRKLVQSPHMASLALRVTGVSSVVCNLRTAPYVVNHAALVLLAEASKAGRGVGSVVEELRGYALSAPPTVGQVGDPRGWKEVVVYGLVVFGV